MEVVIWLGIAIWRWPLKIQVIRPDVLDTTIPIGAPVERMPSLLKVSDQGCCLRPHDSLSLVFGW